MCALKADGGVENMEVQGTMMLEVLGEDEAFCRVKVSTGDTKGYQFKTHPNIDKALHASVRRAAPSPPRRATSRHPPTAAPPLATLSRRASRLRSRCIGCMRCSPVATASPSG